MNSDQFTYVWQYTIHPDYESEFLTAYEANGTWAQFFRPDPGYVRTLLLRDVERTDRYMTIDFWRSKSARDAFRESHAAEFEQIDQQCEAFTVDETFIGDFVVVDGE